MGVARRPLVADGDGGAQELPVGDTVADVTFDRLSAWLPNGAVQSTFPADRAETSSSIGMLVSGRLTIAGGLVLPAGVPLTTITFYTGGTGMSSPTNQWFCLLDKSLNVLARTADAGSSAWPVNSAKSLAIAGGYTPSVSTPAYVGVVVVASTVPTLIGLGLSTAIGGVAPMIAATANTGLTGPSSLTIVGTLTAVPSLAYATVG